MTARERQRHAVDPRVMAERGEQPLDAAAVPLLDDVVEGFAPLPLFEGFELGVVAGRRVSHVRSEILAETGRDYNRFYCRAKR